jgi:hypothetical protein
VGDAAVNVDVVDAAELAVVVIVEDNVDNVKVATYSEAP